MSDIEAFVEAVKSGDLDAVSASLQNPDVVSQINAPLFGFDAPALVNVAGTGNIPLARLLIAAGADVNQKSGWWAGGFAPIHNANEEMSAFLIENGAVVDIYAAAKLGDLVRLKEILSEDPALVNAQGPDGQTALHNAAEVETAELLLKAGANAEIRDIDHGATAAQYAAGKRPEVCAYLLAQGVVPDIIMAAAQGDITLLHKLTASDPELLQTTTAKGPHNPVPAPGEHIYVYHLAFNASPLAVAALCHQFETADALLALGAGINDLPGGASALHHAGWRGNRKAAEYLLSRGADKTLQDKDFSSTPAGWARHAGHTNMADLLE